MADFAKDYTPVKRVILPSSTATDQRWIEIYMEPLAGGQTAGIQTDMSKMLTAAKAAARGLKQGEKPDPTKVEVPDDAFHIDEDFEYQQAVPLIRAWNFKDGDAEAVICSENLQRLQKRDWEALKVALAEVKKSSTITPDKKK